MGERLCQKAFNNISDKHINDFVIALQHHPLNWLNPIDKEDIKNTISKRADVFLSGHIHDNDIVQIITENGQLLECGAGTVYVGKTKGATFKALYGVLDLNSAKITIKATRYSNKRKEWVWDTDYRIQQYDAKNQETIINKFRRKYFEIPILIFAMNKSEAISFFNGSLFDDEYKNDEKSFVELKELLKSSGFDNFEDRYSFERNEWRPYLNSQDSIKDIIMLTFNQFNEIYSGTGLPKLRPRFLNFISPLESIKLSDKAKKRAMRKLVAERSIVVADPISLFNPILMKEFQDFFDINNTKTSLIIFSPHNYKEMPINHLIEKTISEDLSDIITSLNDCLSHRCEIGVGDIRIFKKRISANFPYSPDSLKNYILNKNIKYLQDESGFERSGIEKLWS